MRSLRERTEALHKKRGIIAPWVFHRRSGRPIRDIRRAWVTACIAAGLGLEQKDDDGKVVHRVAFRILHDFRRTAVRRMERAGVPRSVAMKISGHKTESIYRRYAIVAERDIADGLRKVAAFQKRAARAASSTVARFSKRSGGTASRGQMGDNRPPSWVPPPSQVVEGVVAWDGVEPPTRGFSVRCSTS